MAFVRNEHCYVCKVETQHVNGKCQTCVFEEAEKRRKKHFAELDKLTLEERVRRLEEWEYDMGVNPPWRERLLR